MIKTDFLVIGSGVAGLVYALEVAKIGKVIVISKTEANDCNTNHAQGGVAAVLSETDSFENHVDDSFKAGCELGKYPVIETIVRQGPERIKYLISIGAKFSKVRNDTSQNIETLSLTKEGGHTRNRVVYSADSTGQEIMKVLLEQVKNNPNIAIYENHIAIDLITQHHISEQNGFIPYITCWGAYVLNTENGVVEIFRAKKTMLATGGVGQVYEHSTNSSVSTGDGIAMAYLAGARVVNMEFIQFHPTAFYSPGGNSFLVTEALRGEGAVLTLPDGSSFMEKYHPQGSLAPRDIVSRAIDHEMKTKGYSHLYLDATSIDKNILKEHFPFIDQMCRERGIDFTTQPIPIVPSAHYLCGGILATVDGVTDITNLFAAGEVACTGFHGANRLASNSILEALVVAYRAAQHSSNKEEVDFPEIPLWQNTGAFNEAEWVIISHNYAIIKKIMQGYAGIVRSRRLLKYANSRINGIYEEVNKFYNNNPVKKEVIETRNLAIVANIIIRSALSRKESRGVHYVIDYPEMDDKYKRDTVIY
ncbi:MAG: L-aspartate oxidase [Candidatus Cloacimonetes bacterium]|nr:L-aspartate oxidase [Candidatus Cloacimonadota bacterium]